MSGSRLARGRMGRFAILSLCAISIVFIVLLYRSTSFEMARLKDMHIKCAQQQESLAAQLQVVYDYKIQLEKTLSNEKSANAAAKEELKLKATRERSLRDKDSHEAAQRFNALQQTYNQLQSEHKDLQDDCKKKEDVALENAKRLESKLQELRKKATEDKKNLESLKDKYMELQRDRDEFEKKYNLLKKNVDNHDGKVEHLQKQVHQLERELEDKKSAGHFVIGDTNEVQPRLLNNVNSNNNDNIDSKKQPVENNQMQVVRPSSPLQASSAAREDAFGGKSSTKLEAAQALPSPAPASSTVSRMAARPPSRVVKLPHGVPPIPRLIEPEQQQQASNDRGRRHREPSDARGPVPRPGLSADDDAELRPRPIKEPKERADESARRDNEEQPREKQQHLDRREPDRWFQLKHAVQEVGDKNGFDNAGANEDVEQYDDYYKETQNKDLQIEEGEDEHED